MATVGKEKSDEVLGALQACRRYFVNAAIFSLAINLLYLAAPLYMLQVYDRVIGSASVVTLVMLTLALLLAFVALSGLDAIRSRILTRAGIRLDGLLAPRVVAASVESSTKGVPMGSQMLRDYDNFRQFVTGPGINAVFDLPWAPIYIVIIFLLHPLLGAFALVSGMLLVGAALLNQWMVKAALAEAGEASAKNYGFTEMSLRNSEAVLAMGMLPGLLKRWGRDRERLIDRQAAASDRAATFSSLIKFLRLAMQSLILGLGAYLVIERMATVGAMFAASILLSRALQPVEQIVGSWRNLVSARSAFRRVQTLLSVNQPAPTSLALPRPAGALSVENLIYSRQRNSSPILRGVNFRIEPGEIVGVIGPSGAGKSTLVRHIVGVLTPSSGVVRLDGADVAIWPRASFGRHIGYLPQDVELFADTVAANISRFQAGEDELVVEAARLAGAHDLILRLPNGYDTQVGEGGAVLSGGHRQRIGLARAVYGDPSLLVLDEPSSNLDSEGDAALTECILRLKQRGVTIIIVSHRPATVDVADKILFLKDGAVAFFGPRAEMLARLPRPVAVPAVGKGGARSGA